MLWCWSVGQEATRQQHDPSRLHHLLLVLW